MTFVLSWVYCGCLFLFVGILGAFAGNPTSYHSAGLISWYQIYSIYFVWFNQGCANPQELAENQSPCPPSHIPPPEY